MNIQKAFDIQEMQVAAAKASTLLKSLGNGVRLMILCHLSQGELSVGALQERIGIAQSALSQQDRLRRDGLVATRRDAQTIYYALDSGEAAKVIETLYGIYCAPGAPEAAPGHSNN